LLSKNFNIVKEHTIFYQRNAIKGGKRSTNKPTPSKTETEPETKMGSSRKSETKNRKSKVKPIATKQGEENRAFKDKNGVLQTL